MPCSRDVSRALLVLQAAALVAVFLASLGIAQNPWANDGAGIYQAVRGELYGLPWLARGAYVYSPAFAQAVAPLAFLPWEAFWAVWVAIQAGILVAVARPIPAALLLILPWFPFAGLPNPVYATIVNGNPQLVLAGALVVAARYPAAWALPILMKVTPGIGLVWYAARREWRRLGVALGTTFAVIAVSVAIDAGLWMEWLGLLQQAAAADPGRVELLYIPLVVRLLLAVALVIWGARHDWYWTVPIGVMLALPAIAYGGFAVAVAAIPFLRPLAIQGIQWANGCIRARASLSSSG